MSCLFVDQQVLQSATHYKTTTCGRSRHITTCQLHVVERTLNTLFGGWMVFLFFFDVSLHDKKETYPRLIHKDVVVPNIVFIRQDRGQVGSEGE